MLKLTFLVYAPHSMLLGDFKTLADWMTALIERMEGKRFVSVSLRDKANLKKRRGIRSVVYYTILRLTSKLCLRIIHFKMICVWTFQSSFNWRIFTIFIVIKHQSFLKL